MLAYMSPPPRTHTKKTRTANKLWVPAATIWLICKRHPRLQKLTTSTQSDAPKNQTLYIHVPIYNLIHAHIYICMIASWKDAAEPLHMSAFWKYAAEHNKNATCKGAQQATKFCSCQIHERATATMLLSYCHHQVELLSLLSYCHCWATATMKYYWDMHIQIYMYIYIFFIYIQSVQVCKPPNHS